MKSLQSIENSQRASKIIQLGLFLLLVFLNAKFVFADEKKATPAAGSDKSSVINDDERALAEIDSRLRKASVMMGKRQWSAAKKLLREFVTDYPDNAEAQINLGTCSLQLGQMEEASKHLVSAIMHKPHLGYAWTALGLAYFQQEKFDMALWALARAVHESPEDAQAHQYLGLTAMAKGWQIAAEMELQAAIKLAPNMADSYYNLAVVYLDRVPPAVESARRNYEMSLELGAARDKGMEERIKKMSSAAPVSR